MYPKTFTARLEPGCDYIYLSFFADGENLADLINREFRKALPDHPFDDSLPWPFSGDDGLDGTIVGHDVITVGAEFAIIFVCGCGEPACSSTYANVKVTPEEIVFSRFSTYVREEIIADLGPFVFERKQYMQEVERLRQELAHTNFQDRYAEARKAALNAYDRQDLMTADRIYSNLAWANALRADEITRWEDVRRRLMTARNRIGGFP